MAEAGSIPLDRVNLGGEARLRTNVHDTEACPAQYARICRIDFF
jgi:hypothetical protein